MNRRFWWIAFGMVVAVAVGVSAFASAFPDGLEWTADGLGFAGAAVDGAAASGPLAGYGVEGVSSPVVGNAVAGLVGVLVVGALTWGLTRLLRRS